MTDTPLSGPPERLAARGLNLPPPVGSLVTHVQEGCLLFLPGNVPDEIAAIFAIRD